VTDKKFPLVTFRAPPGAILRKVSRRLGLRFHDRTFRDPEEAMAELDRCLDQGIPTAVQTGVFYLPYLPGAFRFHFNAHNIIVFGREGDDYLVSDPVLAEPVRCSHRDLKRARFSRGEMAPRGRLYYPTRVPQGVDLRKPGRDGLKDTVFQMLRIPIPLIGVRGIRRLSKVVREWPRRMTPEMAALNAGHLVLLLEEIGTGGAGFRFMFGAFLQEAADCLGLPDLREPAGQFVEAGDLWREFALLASRTGKGRTDGPDPYERLGEILVRCADRETTALRRIGAILR